MGRRPASDPSIPHLIQGIPVGIPRSVLDVLPDAAQFAAALLARQVSASMAREYLRLTAKLRREGRLGTPELLVQRTERTAANAYWRWIEDSYAGRTIPVIRAFADEDVRRAITWLRVHSLSPPFEGKTVRRVTRLPTALLNPALRDEPGGGVRALPIESALFPCDAWTLHVPRSPVAAHRDPCDDCIVVELDAAKLEVLARAFESAWGHRDLTRVPPECYLFGQPPRETKLAAQDPEATGRVVALMPNGALAAALEAFGGSVTQQTTAFTDRVREPVPDVIVISRKAAGAELENVLAAVRSVWS